MGRERDQSSKREKEVIPIGKSPSSDGLDTEDPLFYKQPRTAIPYRQLRTYEFVGIACPIPRTPARRALWQLLGLAVVALVLLQTLSCGLFFCVTLPVGRAPYMDLRELFTEVRLFNQPQNSFGSLERFVDPVPMLIPRIVHQTFRSPQLPKSLRAVQQSWARVNGPGWQTRFYDDKACLDFVRREFPEYLDAYLALPKDVERSDFFRYMVVLRLGGVYADIDVELRQPLDTVLLPTDTLVVGWEAEVATDAEAFKRHFVRKRQVLQWFFAAAPGHPVLRAACDHIARNCRRTFSNNTNRDTLERTGPGMWTDVVLRSAIQHPAALANDPWKVRILPRVAFGVHPSGIDGLTPSAKEIVVMHHFLGSWRKRGGWHKRRTVLQILAGVIASAWQRHHEVPAAEEPIAPSVLPLFPVSAAFHPPFTIMTHLVGEGDMQSGSDVSSVLTTWGTWQAAMSRPSRRPLAVEALVGSLGPPDQGGVLVDVSAGVGLFSLAAAARGHQVVAFESSARSIAALSAGVVYNGFQERIRLYNVSLGAAPSTLCLRRRTGAEPGAPADGPHGGSQGEAFTAWQAEVAADTEPNDAAAAATRRGYGDPALHGLPSEECAAMRVRQSLAHMLMGDAEAGNTRPDAGAATDGAASTSGERRALSSSPGLAKGATAAPAVDAARHNSSATLDWDESSLPFRVGALRLSAHGWEGWILDGAEPWLARHRPGVVLLEYSPALVARSGYPGGGMRLLQRLYDLGYFHVAHSGYVCDERWYNISQAFRAGATALGEVASPSSGCGVEGGGEGAGCGSSGSKGGVAVAGESGARSAAGSGSSGVGGGVPRQPTWCNLKPDLFGVLTERAHPEVAENVLFIHHTHNSVRGEALPPVQAGLSPTRRKADKTGASQQRDEGKGSPAPAELQVADAHTAAELDSGSRPTSVRPLLRGRGGRAERDAGVGKDDAVPSVRRKASAAARQSTGSSSVAVRKVG